MREKNAKLYTTFRVTGTRADIFCAKHYDETARLCVSIKQKQKLENQYNNTNNNYSKPQKPYKN